MMLKFFLFMHIFTNFWFYFNKIEDSNALKIKAAEAYNTHYYSEAINYYDKLLTEYEPNSDPIKLNLAHSHYKAQSYEAAAKLYTELSLSPDLRIHSTALCQLGVIQHRTKRYKLAIYYFKEALRVNPNNNAAAYNYELLKLTLQKQNNPESPGGKSKGNADSPKKNPDTKNTNSQNIFNPDGSSQSDMYFRMLYEQKRLSKQHAEKILQYIQEQESQYYQKVKKHVPKNINQPDW